MVRGSNLHADGLTATALDAVEPIWGEIAQQLSVLTHENPHFQYLQAVGSGSLTSTITKNLANIQELFVDGSVELSAGEKSRTSLRFQLETMPPVGKRFNEDAFFFEKTADNTTLVIGVIDGATSQLPIAGLLPATGAFHVSHLASIAFTQTAEWKKLAQTHSLDALQVMTALNTWLNKQLAGIAGVTYDNVLTIPGAAASLVTISPSTQTGTFAHVADTLVALESLDNTITILTDNKNETFDHQTGELVAAIAREKNCSYLEAARDVRVKAQLRASFTQKINTPTGCGILNGMPELFNNDLVQHSTFSTKGVKRIIVMSDGAYAPWQQVVSPDLQLPPEFILAVEQARAGGHTPLSITSRLLQTDPDAIKYHRLKPQDDATFVVIDLV